MINMPPKILITSSIIYSQKKSHKNSALFPFADLWPREKKIIQTIYLRVKRGQARARSSNWQPKVRKVLNFLHDDELPSSHLHQSTRFFCRFERDYLWPTDVRNRLIGAEAEGLAARGGSLWIISARLIIPRSAPQKPAGLILTSGGLSLSLSVGGILGSLGPLKNAWVNETRWVGVVRVLFLDSNQTLRGLTFNGTLFQHKFILNASNLK